MFYLWFLLLSFVAGCDATLPTILFTVQSQGITFTQWYEMFTLCLAPLVGHILGGVVSPTLLGSNCPLPSWTARISHFNPTSVIWRYYAIADRRLRARKWDQADMSACNAVFWDGDRRRYDGSEEIMVKSRAWITKIPEKTHVNFLSTSTVASFALTWQGIVATFAIMAGLVPTSPYRIIAKLATVFYPLGCLGLMRLPAALWLSGDYGYLNSRSSSAEPEVLETPLEKTVSDNILQANLGGQLGDESIADRLRPAHCWQGIVFRIFWLLTVWGILGAATVNCSTIWWGYDPGFPYLSLSNLIFLSMYLVLTVASILIHTTYVVTGNATSTIIPCIHATWYKIFTLVFWLAAFLCVVLSAVETRITSSDSPTSMPEFKCGNPGTLCYPATLGQGNVNI